MIAFNSTFRREEIARRSAMSMDLWTGYKATCDFAASHRLQDSIPPWIRGGLVAPRRTETQPGAYSGYPWATFREPDNPWAVISRLTVLSSAACESEARPQSNRRGRASYRRDVCHCRQTAYLNGVQTVPFLGIWRRHSKRTSRGSSSLN